MEVARNAVMKMRTLRPLPGEITNERIRDAALPLKIEAARNAIAKCTDLPELLQMKSQAEGLAAAVRVMKDVGPEMIRAANCLLADAWRKGGELLNQYSNVTSIIIKPTVTQITPGKRGNLFGGAKRGISPRGRISNELGLERHDVMAMVRIAAASKPQVDALVQKHPALRSLAGKTPRLYNCGQRPHSEVVRGITPLLSEMKGAAARVPLDTFTQLTPDERKAVKAKIVEIQELLDEMDRLCR